MTVAAAVAVGCSHTVVGAAEKARPGVPDPDKNYGYVDDRCGLLTDTTVQQTLSADSVVRSYSGAVCQYVLARQTGLIDVVFSWFETGSFDRERGLARLRGATITDTDVTRHAAFLAKAGGGAACSATAAAGTGVVTWWVQYRPPAGGDPCQAAEKLLAATLSSDL